MNIKQITLSAALIAGIIGFIGCENEENILNTQDEEISETDTFGKYTKEITVYDESKLNSAVLLVGSNDQSILDLWTVDNFALITVKNGQSAIEALKDFYGEENMTAQVPIDSINETESIDEMSVVSISTMFLSKTLQKDVKNVFLHTSDPYDPDLRSWKYETHYSGAHPTPATITCYVYGGNFWYLGYYGLEYKPTISSTWGTLVGEWKAVYNEDTPKHTKICYQMKARRKYKGSGTPSCRIEFDD